VFSADSRFLFLLFFDGLHVVDCETNHSPCGPIVWEPLTFFVRLIASPCGRYMFVAPQSRGAAALLLDVSFLNVRFCSCPFLEM